MFSLKDLKDLKDLRKIDKDDLLEMVGLQTRRGAEDLLLPALGFFSLGLLVGAGIGLLMAPKSGRELREDLTGRLGGNLPDRLSTAGAGNAETQTRMGG